MEYLDSRTDVEIRSGSVRHERASMRRLLLVVVLIALTPTPAYAQTSTSERPRATPASNSEDAAIVKGRTLLQGLEPEVAGRGDMITVTGEFPTSPVAVTVQLESVAPTQSLRVINVERVSIREEGKSFSFIVPRTAPLGKYDVVVNFSQKGKSTETISVPMAEGGAFTIAIGDPVKIDAIYPVVNYPVNGTFGFKIIGSGFGPMKEDNHLDIVGQGLIRLCDDSQTTDCVNAEIIDPGREIRFWGVPLTRAGVQHVRVRVGDEYSEKPVAVTFSRVNRRTPALIAALLLLLFVALVVFVLRKKNFNTLAEGIKVGVLGALFLDKETTTYSLNKLQFYLWMGAAVFGYLYLSVARSLVQGNFEFADIPENLPGIIFVAASTSVLAIGITSAKGSKGAGDQRPSLADFVTSGGVVAAERIQFLIWTLIGVGAFVFLTLSIEPGRIENLPSVPERFLYLMGISSFGYLSGKLGRRPGPVITQIEAEEGSLILQVHDSNLSPDATFKIDETDINPKLLDNAAHRDGRPQVLTNDETPPFAKVLRLVIATPEKKWLEGDHNFTITNPDGQKAVLRFAVKDTSNPV